MKTLRLALAALAVGLAAPALAASAQTTFTVNATVAANCSIAAAPINFPSYDPVNPAAVSATGTITVTCTATTPWTVGLNAGTGGAAGGATRSMSLGAGRLGYDLFRDAGHTQIWDNANPNAAAGTGTGAAQPVTVYGQIAANQTAVAPGTYQDTITATVNF